MTKMVAGLQQAVVCSALDILLLARFSGTTVQKSTGSGDFSFILPSISHNTQVIWMCACFSFC